jgi:hypothetical protein
VYHRRPKACSVLCLESDHMSLFGSSRHESPVDFLPDSEYPFLAEEVSFRAKLPHGLSMELPSCGTHFLHAVAVLSANVLTSSSFFSRLLPRVHIRPLVHHGKSKHSKADRSVTSLQSR